MNNKTVSVITTGLVFLCWTFGFWPAMFGTAYLGIQAGFKFMSGDSGFIFSIVWLVGIVATFRLWRAALGMREDS